MIERMKESVIVRKKSVTVWRGERGINDEKAELFLLGIGGSFS